MASAYFLTIRCTIAEAQQSPATLSRTGNSMTIINEPSDLGRAVREARRAQNLRQADLAATAATSVRFIVD